MAAFFFQCILVVVVAAVSLPVWLWSGFALSGLITSEVGDIRSGFGAVQVVVTCAWCLVGSIMIHLSRLCPSFAAAVFFALYCVYWYTFFNSRCFGEVLGGSGCGLFIVLGLIQICLAAAFLPVDFCSLRPTVLAVEVGTDCDVSVTRKNWTLFSSL